jgi:NAD(P)H-flavin reductase/ferredoxin
MTTLHLPQSRLRIPMREGETVLEAALAAGVPFPHSCKSGRCGACKARLVSGDVTLLEHSPFALDATEKQAGSILACRAIPLNDVTVAWTDDRVVTGVRASIMALHDMTADIHRLVLRPETPIAFNPGQFFEIELAPGISRSYSIASEIGAEDLEFHVRRIPGGRASQLITAELEPGHEVRVSGPFGSAVGTDKIGATILTIAASTGHAPVKSILTSARTSRGEHRVHLLSFARHHRDFYLDGFFRHAASENDSFTYQTVKTTGVDGAATASPLAAAIAGLDCSLLGGQIYIAGPPGFVDAAAALVSARPCTTGDVLTDRFELRSQNAGS